MQLKRFLTSVLVVLVLLTLTVFSAAAEDAAGMTLNAVPTSGTAEGADGSLNVIGDTLTVDVVLNNNSGVAYLFVEMEYDPEILAVKSVQDSGKFPFFGGIKTSTAGKISVVADFLGDYENVTDVAPVVMTITFDVIGHGDAAISFVNGTLAYDANNAKADVELVDTTLKAHTFTTKTVTPPNCTDAGYTTYKCAEAGCNASYVVAGDAATGHINTVAGTPSAPTCTGTGLTAGVYCNDCKTWIVPQETVPATGHTVVDVEQQDAVCGVDGHKAGRACKFCDYIESGCEVIPAVSQHKEYVYMAAKDPTCTESGYTAWIKCEICQADVSIREDLPALGHDYTSVVTAPTCTTMGYTTNTCACGDVTVTAYVDALGHTIVVDEAVEPTYSEEGKTKGSHCSVCNEVITAQDTIPTKSLAWLWITIVVVVVVVGGGVAAYFFLIKKKA